MNDFIKNLSRRSKWVILLSTDVVIIALAFYAAFALRFGSLTPFVWLNLSWPMLPILIVLGAIYAILLGMPKIKLHGFEIQATKHIAICAGLLSLSAMSLSFVFVIFAPRSVPIIFGVMFFLGAVSARIIALNLLLKLQNYGKVRTSVIVYGAGNAGIQLASALRQSSGVKLVAFVDDNIMLQKLIVAGLPVHAPDKLKHLVVSRKVKRVLVAMPSLTKVRQREILKQLEGLACDVQVLPSYVQMIEGKSILESLRTVTPEELLGRDKLDLIIPDVANAYRGKSVLISGAGGSIGSELCRQILKLAPAKIIMFEQSELALYQVERDLGPLAINVGVHLEPVLGSVSDPVVVENIFRKHHVQVVLHAAAYKHVPLVEANELAGLSNNVLGTQTLAKVASQLNIERFVLISTDKAVRPTNVMGASKRLAELVVQDIGKRSDKTIFSMVRFGNVLGSSGSVIPLFREQIAKGGPITLTHSEVTRFFMATSEAASLVLIAGSLATGGDVFVLDMGKSVKIKDLAKRMIVLSGLSVLDDDNPEGDIEIKIIGLRPGEKLYEELLVGGETLHTPHPKILRAKEGSLSEIEIAKALKDLRSAIENNDVEAARAMMVRWVDGYHKSDAKGDDKLPANITDNKEALAFTLPLSSD